MKQEKKKKQSLPHKVELKKQPQQATSKNVKPSAKTKNYNSNILWILAGIVVLTLIVYSKSIGNGFTNWDEDEYIVDNPLLSSFNLKAIFTHFLAGNYHPLTELIYAVEYHLWGLTAKGYHLVNTLLHVCNSVFVFYVILLLSKRTEVAAVTALLFAVNPMHVESVVWAAELKDLLYTFFFLASYICYIKYIFKPDKKLYLFSLLLFLLSLLSKAMAASLPVVFILTDYFMGRKLTMKTVLEKLPFFALALVFGIVAIVAQHSAGAIQDIPDFPLFQRDVFACYGFISYIYKLIIPVNLSAFYPFPVKTSAGIPSWYYLFPVIFLVLAGSVIYTARYSRKIIFGMGFFLITVFLVLQLLPVGSAIMADRYTYIPSIGLFYLAGEGFYWLWNKKSLRVTAMILLILAAGSFSYATYARSEVWKNGMTLWNDMLSKYQNVSFAYNNRGRLYLNDNNYDEALNDFNMAIKLQPRYSRALNNRGVVYSYKKKYDDAKRDFDKSIQYDSTYVVAYANRGNMLLDANRYSEAINDFSKTIEKNPNSPQAFYNRARAEISLGKKDVACMDLQQAMNLRFQGAEDAYNHFCR